ncbi:hypothetical protein JDS99_29355 [Bacillus cereus group sp. N6]|uniref:hypothetical protein n=1 Tax=Bacillus cereus group sp. N6 TaxID=2794583 RepID=UPI0018F7538C|nr:hypothetical protein [Bacillus cereus group sp. N6]MBJ8113643.1 hypothetical protein [Bacillus cereus group sp. N6]
MEVQRVLQEEIREKKRTASGVHHKTGKRGYVGKMLFPTDMLKGKEKRSYQKASKVEISNMYETMMSRAEFEALPVGQQKQMLQGYRIHFHLKDILKHWKMSTATLYTLIKELELPALPKENVLAKRKESRQKNRRTSKETKQKSMESVLPVEQISLFDTDSEVVHRIAAAVPVQGYRTILSGVYSSEELISRLLKMGALLEGEENMFRVQLVIEEQEK